MNQSDSLAMVNPPQRRLDRSNALTLILLLPGAQGQMKKKIITPDSACGKKCSESMAMIVLPFL